MAARLLDTHSAWHLVLDAVNRTNVTLSLPEDDSPALELNGSSWRLLRPATDSASNLLKVFLPLCRPVADGAACRVVGQLGQSLDGRIATVTGASKFINGEDGLTHLHRIRAVSDAVIVGAGTATADNPRLTVRKASGANPVRVVIDRHRRVPEDHHLFTDGQAPTLRLVAGAYSPKDTARQVRDAFRKNGLAEIPCLGAANAAEPAAPQTILKVLSDCGLHKIFVEGGGVTVSAFLNAGLLNRLHVMVSPMIIGSGRPAFSLPEIDLLSDALRPRAHLVNLGSDMLFDLDFSEQMPPN